MAQALYPGYATARGTVAYLDNIRAANADYLGPSWFSSCAALPGLALSRLVLDISGLNHKTRVHQDTVREALISGTNQLALHGKRT